MNVGNFQHHGKYSFSFLERPDESMQSRECTYSSFPAAPHELTEEEKQQILHSEEFLSFFDHSTRIVERALSEQINIFFDYSGRDLEDKEG